MLRPTAKEPQKFLLSDYTPPSYLTETIELVIDLSTTPATVKSTLHMKPASGISAQTSLKLDGEKMDLISVRVNDVELTPDDYTVTNDSLTIHADKVPVAFEFTVSTETKIQNHADLFGKYEVDGVVLIKAETQGMRRVTYLQDSPDVRTKYYTKVIAHKDAYPQLLCNGVLTHEYDLANGRHAVVWSDDVPKPSYLFAMVAGKLAKREDVFVTRSGNRIPITVFADAASLPKCEYAIEIIKQSWRFDEEVFGLECDLPEHKVVGIPQYAAGASETTTLNLFNLQNLVAEPATSSDKSFMQTANTVSHEVFHGWSGNHVTIRDWWNLAGKEGMTVLRALLFLKKTFGAAFIRTMYGKLPEDNSASRPDSYVAVRNLYSLAAYDKAAELFHMIMLIMGEEKFYQAVHDFYVENDGGSVTLEDMLKSWGASAEMDLSPMLPWFTETGSVDLQVEDEYDPDAKCYTLKFKQSSSSPNYKVRPIPVVLGLIDRRGNEYAKNQLCVVTEAEQSFTFDNVPFRPVPSLLRSYSALAKLKFNYNDDELLLLMQFDSDFPNRRIAFNKFIISNVKKYCADRSFDFKQVMIDVYRQLLLDKNVDHWSRAIALEMPTEEEMVDELGSANINQIREARKILMTTIADELSNEWQTLFTLLQAQPDVEDPQLPGFDMRDAGKRAMIACCQKYLACIRPNAVVSNLRQQFLASLGSNMNDALTALTILSDLDSHAAQEALDQFYAFYQDTPLAINYWFGVQAGAHADDTVANVRKLLSHPAFDMKTPSCLLGLFRPFVRNLYGFHAASGAGYQLLAEVVIALDKFNPAMAANLVNPFTRWDSYDKERQKLMYTQLQNLLKETTSPAVREKIVAALQKGNPLSSSPLAGRIMAMPQQTTTGQVSPEGEKKRCKHN